MMPPKTALYVYVTLCASFLAYSIGIYLTPIPATADPMAGEGKLVYQKYNCQSCHQLYNLGGYLGPDLTNCYSAAGKGPLFIKAMVVTGTKQMPAFQLNDKEMDALLAFFKAMDATGSSDLRHFTTLPNGMIEHHAQ